MMNRSLRHTSTLLAAGFAALAFTACSKESRDNVADKSQDAYQDGKAAVAQGWDDIKSYTYDRRSDFTQSVKARQADLEAGMSKLRAEYSEAQASASRQAAMAELRNDEADFNAKMAALGNATAATWDAARDDAAHAWDKLQASYAKARAN